MRVDGFPEQLSHAPGKVLRTNLTQTIERLRYYSSKWLGEFRMDFHSMGGVPSPLPTSP